VSARRTVILLRRTAIVGGIALAALPASAAAANPWQHSDFRLVGGSRYTLTLSPQQQIPGIEPAIWPKGYRYVCKTSGPVLRHRINWMRSMNDYADITVDGLYAKPGTLSYKKLGLSESYAIHPGMPHTFPRTADTAVQLASMVGSPATGKLAALSPALGLYDFRVVPYSTYSIIPIYAEYTLPAATLTAKLDVRQGTAAECPRATEVPWAYYRASK
jgi:hypothetical protein